MPSLLGLLGQVPPSGLLGPYRTSAATPTTLLFDALQPSPASFDEPTTPLLELLRPQVAPLARPPAPSFDWLTPESLNDPFSTFGFSSAFPPSVRGPNFPPVPPPTDLAPWPADLGLIGAVPRMRGDAANFSAPGGTFPRHCTNAPPESPPEKGPATRSADEQFARSNQGNPAVLVGDQEVTSDADPELWIPGADYAQARSGRGRGPVGRELVS